MNIAAVSGLISVGRILYPMRPLISSDFPELYGPEKQIFTVLSLRVSIFSCIFCSLVYLLGKTVNAFLYILVIGGHIIKLISLGIQYVYRIKPVLLHRFICRIHIRKFSQQSSSNLLIAGLVKKLDHLLKILEIHLCSDDFQRYVSLSVKNLQNIIKELLAVILKDKASLFVYVLCQNARTRAGNWGEFPELSSSNMISFLAG